MGGANKLEANPSMSLAIKHLYFNLSHTVVVTSVRRSGLAGRQRSIN